MIELCIIEDDLVNFLSKIDWGSAIGYLVGIGGLILTWWNVHKLNQKPKARLLFANGKKEIILTPHYYNKTSTKYYIVPYPEISHFDKYHEVGEKYQKKHEHDNEFLLSFHFSNIGKLQLENYRVEIECTQGSGTFFSTQLYKLRKDGILVGDFPTDGVSIQNDKKPQIVYSPFTPHPLNQEDSEDFSVRFIPKVDVEKIELNWRIIAKDFSHKGKFIIYLKPYTTFYDEIIPIYTKNQVPEGAETVEDLTPYTKQFED